MSPVRIDPGHFSPDTLAFLRELSGHDVRYLIVGGEAVILHGHVRLTGDVDVFYANDPDNRERLYAALLSFWDGIIPGVDSVEELGSEGSVIQFGRPPNRIDLLNDITGVTFEEAWPERVETVVGESTLRVPYIGVAALVKNKRASGRPRDLADVEYLDRDA